MSSVAVLARRRALRWLVPAGVVGIAGLFATGVFSPHAASPALPRTSAAALIAQVRNSDAAGFSGTVVSTFALGLPDLSSLDGDDGASLSSLLLGSHTMQVWYGGVAKQRVALLGATEETDVFRNGSTLWEWSSAQQTAVHTTLPARAASATIASSTPQQLATRLLALLDATTLVRVEHEHDVADRASYELVLTPRSTTTLVGTVRIAVDGRTKVPLGVQVFARGADSPAIDVSFTSIRFARPSDRNFEFTPPSDARVRRMPADSLQLPGLSSPGVTAGGSGTASTGASAPGSTLDRTVRGRSVQVVGSGWSRIVVARFSPAELDSGMLHSLIARATDVSGEWGHGLLVQTPLVDALVADDGRVFIGPVQPGVLYAAAARK